MNRTTLSAARAILLSVGAISLARADDGATLAQALGQSKPIVDLRFRYEEVKQVPLLPDAVALTARARLGVQTGTVWGTSLLAEGNVLVPVIDDYRPDNASPYHSKYPLVADPKEAAVNRLQITNTSLPDTTAILGRQRINLDDQRFVGAVGWRQDEQTFDALRIINHSLGGLTIDATYIDRVHRAYGVESPQGAYRGESFLGNLSYPTPWGRLTGFAYLLDFQPITSFAGLTVAQAAPLNPARTSSNTYGVRFSGQRVLDVLTLGYTLSYAAQRQRGDNPLTFSNSYGLAEISAGFRGFTAVVGDEIMQGNGTVGFSTPLATIHQFDGWADKFLMTPANGLDNRYAKLNYQVRSWGRLDLVGLSAIYRSFAAQEFSVSYGAETDLQLTGKWRHCTGSMIFADYRASSETPLTLARDTQKFWLQLEYLL